MMSQKCGICQRNIKPAKAIKEAVRTSWPVEKNPINGGRAPTSAPGIIERGVFLLSLVYRILYNITVRMPRINGRMPLQRRIRLPETNKANEINKALLAGMIFRGRGLFIVLPILASIILSVYWFIAAEPEARRKIPIIR